MRERSICRHCVSLQSRRLSGRRPFAIHGAKPHYAPDLPFRLEHILLDVTVDPTGKRLEGKVTQRVRAVTPGQTSLKLDQIGLKIREATVAGKKAPFSIEGNSLRIELAQPSKPGDVFEFTVAYSVENPRRGLYFTGPDKDYPSKPHQVWSQGQDEDNRYWFPTFDYPNQKATSEVIASVPKGYTAVSNGALLSRTEEGGRARFHYKLGTPHVTYLITLTVAEFVEWADAGPRGLPVQYFVAPGLQEDGKRAFGNTPSMIERFEAVTGMPYPYEKYSQVAVQDFIFGGMENTSATTQTDSTLHDARAHLDFSSDPLVSHELAHQWFGDLLTCRDWSHGWLNEGFATFMERVWIEGNVKDYGSREAALEEAKYYSYQDLKEYLEDDASHYRRPIVCNTYIEPIDLFDTHLYQKGGLVLNFIRHVLGEELFWKSIQLYVGRHRGSSVETLDLVRAIEDATGRNLRRLFDQWVFGAGHPELEISYTWHEDKKTAELVIEQKQTGGEAFVTKDGATTHLFHLPLDIELSCEGGKTVSHRVEFTEARERVFLSAPSKPLMARVDRGNAIPKTLKFPRPKEMLLHQLASDPDCMGRIEAAKELAKMPDAEVIAALSKAVQGDRFWGVQAEAADTLSKIRMDSAREALVAGLAVPHPKARLAVVRALATFKDEAASKALRKVVEAGAAGKGEPSYFVEAGAVYGAAATMYRPSGVSAAELEHIESFLVSQLEKPSYREVIRAAALRALAEMPGIGRGERPKSMQALIAWTARGKPMDARMAAVSALGRVARTANPVEKARVFELYSALADEEGFRLRMTLIASLASTETVAAIPLLEKLRGIELDGRARRNALLAIDDLAAAGGTPESVTQLKASLEKLEEEYRKLRSLVEEQKGFAAVAAKGPAGASGAEVGAGK